MTDKTVFKDTDIKYASRWNLWRAKTFGRKYEKDGFKYAVWRGVMYIYGEPKR